MNPSADEKKQKKAETHSDYWHRVLKHQRLMCPICKTTYNITHKSHHERSKRHLKNLSSHEPLQSSLLIPPLSLQLLSLPPPLIMPPIG